MNPASTHQSALDARPPETLCLEFLGGCSVTRAGAPIPGLVSAKAHALLAFLAVTGRQHSREALAGLFWSEQPEEEARASLRQVLAQLRRLLGAYILAGRSSVAFNRSAPYRLDVEDLLEAIRGLGPDADSACLQATFDLYRGDLLSGFSIRGAPAFDEWLVTQREYVRQVAVGGLRMLADVCAARHEYAGATQALSRMLTLDPWNEDAHRQLMRLLAENGQRTAALAQYATLRRILAEELDAEPESGTVEEAEAIRWTRPQASRRVAQQPARANVQLCRPRSGVGRATPNAADDTSADADRTRRLRQDAPGAGVRRHIAQGPSHTRADSGAGHCWAGVQWDLACGTGQRSRPARRATDGIVHALAMLASLASADGRPLESLRLAAATTALCEASGCPIAPVYRGRFERWIGLAKQATTSQAAADAWAEGRSINLEQALTGDSASINRRRMPNRLCFRWRRSLDGRCTIPARSAVCQSNSSA